MNGALLIDKPAGLSSAQVVARIKRSLGADKVGHAGTLDPGATGLLVVLVGRATKLQDRVMLGHKEYTGTFRAGLATDTDDIWGKETERSDTRLTREEFDACRSELEAAFTGKIMQAPPRVSAVKVNGVRSYKLARKGVAVQHAPREVEILRFELSYESADELGYVLECSKGTYVRSLASDLGARLGIPMVVSSIRRTKVGCFRVSDAVTLDAAGQEHLISLSVLQDVLGARPEDSAYHCEFGSSGVLVNDQ